jgi:lysophospholipase L1-like esterase
MIGINDVWRRFDSNDPVEVERFRETYRAILRGTKEALDAQVVLCEPFLLPVLEEQREWREDLDPKIDAVRCLAREFGAVLVPLDGVFAAASTRQACTHWTFDGVHPTDEGHELIAAAWVRNVLGEEM